jgi:hypothetical protein
MDNPDFLSSVVVPLIGITSGILTTKWITNSWQKRKEKADIKKMILLDFSNSVKLRVGSAVILTNKIRGAYRGYSDQGRQFYYIIWPSKKKDRPLEKFANSLKEFEERRDNSLVAGNNFFSNIRLYLSIPSLEETFKDLETHAIHLESLAEIILHSNSAEELSSNLMRFDSYLSLVSTFQGEFEKSLVNSVINLPKD